MEIKGFIFLIVSIVLLLYWHTKVDAAESVKEKINYLSMLMLGGFIIIIGVLIEIAGF
jgi:hypothetical protein